MSSSPSDPQGAPVVGAAPLGTQPLFECRDRGAQLCQLRFASGDLFRATVADVLHLPGHPQELL